MASDSVTIQFRPICIEDNGTFTTLAQVNAPVLGVGVVPITPVLSATNDTAATAAGLSNGDVYIQTGVFPIRYHTLGGGGGGSVTKLVGSGTITLGAISDGVAINVGNITVTGAVLGDPVTVGTSPALPVGMVAIGKVTSSNTVQIEVWNYSTIPQTPGATLFNVTIIH